LEILNVHKLVTSEPSRTSDYNTLVPEKKGLQNGERFQQLYV